MAGRKLTWVEVELPMVVACQLTGRLRIDDIAGEDSAAGVVEMLGLASSPAPANDLLLPLPHPNQRATDGHFQLFDLSLASGLNSVALPKLAGCV